MSGIPLVRVEQIIQITTALRDFGTSPERLMDRLNMPRWHDCPPDRLAPLTHAYQLMHHGARSVGTETFGAQVIERTPFPAGLGTLIAAAPNVYQMLETFVRRLPTYGTSKTWWLTERPDEIWLCRGGGHLFEVGEAAMTQYALTGAVQMVRLGAGPAWRPTKVLFRGADMQGLERTEMFSDARIQRDPEVSAIAVPRSILSLPLRRSDRRSEPLDLRVDGQPQAALPAEDFAGSLRQVIGTLLAEGYPQIQATAETVGLSVRTLQRRMAGRGLTYSRLVEDARFEAATHALTGSAAPVSDVAFDLGYTDPANFGRAFRRWAGLSPQAYRRQCRLAA
jgi:AraC-like DNA-binding protein